MSNELDSFREYENIFDFLNHKDVLESEQNVEEFRIYSWVSEKNPFTVEKLERVNHALEFLEPGDDGSKELRQNIFSEDSPETAFAEIILVGKLREELGKDSVIMNPNFSDLEKDIECNPDILVELGGEKIIIEVTSTSATRKESENKPDNEVYDINELRKGNHFSNKLTDKLNQLEDLWETDYKLAVAFHTSLIETDRNLWFRNFIRGDIDSLTIYHDDDGEIKGAKKNLSPPAIRMEENSQFLDFAILFSYLDCHLYIGEQIIESTKLNTEVEFDSVTEFDSETVIKPENFPE